jgi:hypothetical protein
MLTAFGLLVILDAIILSASPDMTRITIAIIVTLIVVIFVAVTWRRNSGLEKKTAPARKRDPGGILRMVNRVQLAQDSITSVCAPFANLL